MRFFAQWVKIELYHTFELIRIEHFHLYSFIFEEVQRFECALFNSKLVAILSKEIKLLLQFDFVLCKNYVCMYVCMYACIHA